jgi:hypothetical protein
LHFLLIVQHLEVIDILWHQSNQKLYIRNQGMKMIHDKSLQSNLGTFSNEIETQFISWFYSTRMKGRSTQTKPPSNTNNLEIISYILLWWAKPIRPLFSLYPKSNNIQEPKHFAQPNLKTHVEHNKVHENVMNA